MFMLLNYTNIKQMVIHDRRPKELFSNSDESGSKLNYVWFPKGMFKKQSTNPQLEENQYYYSEDPI